MTKLYRNTFQFTYKDKRIYTSGKGKGRSSVLDPFQTSKARLNLTKNKIKYLVTIKRLSLLNYMVPKQPANPEEVKKSALETIHTL